MQQSGESCDALRTCQQPVPPRTGEDYRYHDVEHDRQDQGVPRDRDRGHAQQQRDDGRKREDHDDIVERHLGQGETRVTVGQVAPDKHHGGAGCGGQQDQAGNIAVDLLRGQPVCEQHADEQPAQQRHRERLDGPVDEQRDTDPARVMADLVQGMKVDLEQHRQDHQPYQHGHRHVHARDLQAADSTEHVGECMPQDDADRDAQQHPQAQVTLEKTHGEAKALPAGSLPAAGCRHGWRETPP